MTASDEAGQGQLAASIPLPILLLDEEGRINSANDASEAFFGRSNKRLLGSHVKTVLNFKSQRLNAALASNESDITAQNMEVQLRDGINRSVDVYLTASASHIGWRTLLLVPRLHDRDHLGEQNESGSQQAMGAPAILGHEIKNPLAGIKGAAQLLSKRVNPADTALTSLIVTEVDRISKLLDQMQNLGSVGSAQLEACNIHELIEKAIRSIRAANSFIPSIAINYDPSLPDVWIDPDSMVQVLINLLQNAIDAVKDSVDPEIGIATRFVLGGALRDAAHVEGGARAIKLPVEVSISDNGPGIAAHIEKELFSPFVTTKRDGQGLGLAIVRKLVLQMHGRITVDRDTAENRTIFQLYLPVARKERSA